MDITITLTPQPENDRHAVLWNEELSHHVAASEVEAILDDSRRGLWRSQPASGAMLGARLFELFNGSGGQLERALQEVYHNGQPLTLIFRMPFELDALPIELLFPPHLGPLPEGEGDLLPSPFRLVVTQISGTLYQ